MLLHQVDSWSRVNLLQKYKWILNSNLFYVPDGDEHWSGLNSDNIRGVVATGAGVTTNCFFLRFRRHPFILFRIIIFSVNFRVLENTVGAITL